MDAEARRIQEHNWGIVGSSARPRPWRVYKVFRYSTIVDHRVTWAADPRSAERLGVSRREAVRTAVSLWGDAGIQRFSLHDHGVELSEGTDYEWSVAVVRDVAARSADVLSSGAIRRVAPTAQLAARLAGLFGTARARALAEAGIWYDSLGVLSRELDANADPAIREARADLLMQVGLQDAAAFERP